MIIGRFFAYMGICFVVFATLAIGGLGLVKMGEMLGTPDAVYAKGVIVAGVAGMVVSLLAGWWDASHE
jgi:hypothetical protein